MNTCKLIVSQRIFKGLSLKEIRTISYAESPTKVRNSKIRLVDNGDLKYNGNRLLFLLAQFSKMTGIGWMQGLEEPKTKKWWLCSNIYSIERFICLALVLSADRHRCKILLKEDVASVVWCEIFLSVWRYFGRCFEDASACMKWDEFENTAYWFLFIILKYSR